MPRVEQVQEKALEEFRQRNRNSAKRKKEKNSRQVGEALITFVCLFFLLSLFFLQVAKKMTPKIDTSVGNNTEISVEQPETKGTIDDRLKLIQFNDQLVTDELRLKKEREIFNESLEEKVVLPKDKTIQNDETQDLSLKVQDIIAKNITEVNTLENQKAPVEPVVKAPIPPIKVPPVVSPENKNEDLDRRISAIKNTAINLPQSNNYKVFVGTYQTAEQAQFAKSILRETELGQNAFVKYVNNSFTVQIGSYSTKEQASFVANQLTTNSFPARVYYEKPQTQQSEAKTIF